MEIGGGWAQKLTVEDGNLDKTRPESGDELTEEHGPWWQLEVSTKLHILCKGETLGHGDVSIYSAKLVQVNRRTLGNETRRTGLEQHHGVGCSRNHVTDQEFGENVKTKLDVGNGLDHTNGNDPDG